MTGRTLLNIGPRERRRRLAGGVVILAAGAGVALALVFAGANRWWRLSVFSPFWLGALGIFQARAGT